MSYPDLPELTTRIAMVEWTLLTVKTILDATYAPAPTTPWSDIDMSWNTLIPDAILDTILPDKLLKPTGRPAV